MRKPIVSIKGKKKIAALCILGILGIYILARGYYWHSSSLPDSDTVRAVDSLNDKVRRARFVCPDSALLLARDAVRISRNYEDGRNEALNHQMFVRFLRMDFDGCLELYNHIQQTTDNQIELLISEVNMMMISQRAAQNRMFFDYYNRALERIRRIREEYDEIEGRTKERLDYALVEFNLTTSDCYMHLMQEQEAGKHLQAIDMEGYIQQNKDLLTDYYYQSGVVIQNREDLGPERIIDAFDNFYLSYTNAVHCGNIYFTSLLEQVFSEIFSHSSYYNIIQKTRATELDYLYNIFVTEEETLPSVSPSLNLSTAMAKKALNDAGRCGSLLLKINGYRVLGNVMFVRGEYNRALNCLETALSYLNLHHQMFYPEDKKRLLASYEAGGDSAVDMQWAIDANIQTIPVYLAYIRERLSVTYSALNEKQKSDFNRNLYLDLMDFTRQDKSLESRAILLSQDNKILNTVLITLIILTLIFCFFLFLYAHKWKKRDAEQYSLLKEMSDWFMAVAFARSEQGLDEAFNVYPWIKKEKRILREIIRPYIKWMEKNRTLSGQMDEERMQLQEDFLQNERQIARDKRKNISKRAKVSLVHSITPFIDRILYTVHKMEKRNQYDEDSLEYIGELAGEINKYNNVLAEWIRLNHGELGLTIESFPIQELFTLLEKGRYNFKRKDIDFQVIPSDAWVKADRALTFFMLNTLIDNARKFTPAGGRVTVSAEELEDAVDIKVLDTGCGLTESEIELIMSSKIYDAQQIGLGSSSIHKEKGSGFGLLNCKGIIEKYRKSGEFFNVCRFHVESKEKQGCCFSFRLPKGVIRSCMLLLILITQSFFCPAEIHAIRTNVKNVARSETGVDYGELTQALFYADSVYFSNVDGNYYQSMRYADSCFKYINIYYADLLPRKCINRRLTTAGCGTEELEWLSQGIKADYYLIMCIRNEVAVAALGLHEWDIYEFNNIRFTHLYKLLTKDESLGRFYAGQRSTQANLSVSLVLLVLVFFTFIFLVYIVYFRRRILFRFNVMQVLGVNQAMLKVVDKYEQCGNTGEMMSALLSVVLSRLKELHETNSIRLLLYRSREDKLGVFSRGNSFYEVLSESLLDRAYETETVVFDEISNIQAYPLLVRTGKNELFCIGSLAVNYGIYRMQKKDFVLEEYIVNYLTILLYEAVIQRGYRQDNMENAETDKQRSLYERARIRVQNHILDNCLSTIKHESIYYPNRIRQLVQKMEGQTDKSNLKDNIRFLCELAEYYKEIYTQLCAQADRQIDSGYFKCEKLSPHDVIKEWMKLQVTWMERNTPGVALVIDERLPDDSFMNADSTLVAFMLETLAKEWAMQMKRKGGEGRLMLQVSEDGGFIRFSFMTSVPIYTHEEAMRLFFPDVDHYSYLLCKEIVREHDKLNNFCGCRINVKMETESPGCCIWFTVPKYS